MLVTLSRLYNDDAAARKVVDDLQAAGLPEDNIGIIARSRTDPMENADTENADDMIDRDRDGGDDRSEAARTGAAIGSAAGLFAGLGLLMVPGLGAVAAAGWVATAIGATLAGGAAGGMIGALSQAGISDNDAAQYADGVRRGATLVTIRVMGRDRELYEAILDANGIARDRSSDPAGIAIPPRH